MFRAGQVGAIAPTILMGAARNTQQAGNKESLQRKEIDLCGNVWYHNHVVVDTGF
jgi:hypothetical protein